MCVACKRDMEARLEEEWQEAMNRRMEVEAREDAELSNEGDGWVYEGGDRA